MVVIRILRKIYIVSIPNFVMGKNMSANIQNKNEKPFFGSDKLSAIFEFLTHEYSFSENDIICESDSNCTAVRPATDYEIERWTEFYEKFGVCVNSYYSYGFGKNGGSYRIHVIESLENCSDIVVEVSVVV